MISKSLYAAVFVFLLPLTVFSQGLFQYQVYGPEVYNDFRQNWAAIQDSSGIMLFGNSNGLLSFNGETWESKDVPSGRAIVSFKEFNNRIHWSGVGDFGMIGTDSLNQIVALSLKEQVDSSYHNFSAVWQIVEFKEDLYHRAPSGLYIYERDTVTVISSEEDIEGLFRLNDQLLLNVENRGLSYLEGDIKRGIPGSEAYGNDILFIVLQREDDYLLVSRNQGIVAFDGLEFTPIQTDASKYLIENGVYRAVQLSDTKIVFATLRGGIVITNLKGELQSIFTEVHGLPTNLVTNLYLDQEKNLWVTTENGIATLLINNPLTTYDERTGFVGNTLFIKSLKGQIIVGTTEGLFTIDDVGHLNRFEEINNRFLDAIEIDGEILLATADGVQKISGRQMEKISRNGYNFFIKNEQQARQFFGIKSDVIDRLHYENGKLSAETILELDVRINDLFIDGENIWIAASDNSVMQTDMDGNLTNQFFIDLSEQQNFNQIGKLTGTIAVATDAGLFRFDEGTSQFEPDDIFPDEELNSKEVFRFQQCRDGDIWFWNARKMKRAIHIDGEWTVRENPYNRIAYNEALEVIYCDDKGNLLFGGSQNLYHLTDPDWTYDHDFNTNITAVLIHNDSLIYGGYGDPAEIKKLKFEENELRFTYAAASYIEPEANQYRTRLRGYEDEWSNWSGEPQKDYTFIPEGTYTFEVQGRNVYHKTGSIDSYTFTVLPPWYRTIWAYLGYLILFGGMVYAGHRIRINSILKEQRIRDGIARDLHDELSSTLSSISFFANAIDSPKLNEKEGNRFLSLIKKSSLEAKEKISDIVWVIQSENDDWDNLLMRCKRFSADILDAGDIKHRFEIKGTFTGKPTLTQKKNIWLIFREILTNIARHAEPSQVDIRFSLNDNQLHIRIEDDGKGFDPDHTREGGYGLQNIKNRAKQLKADCTLESMPGEGTRWVIEVSVG